MSSVSVTPMVGSRHAVARRPQLESQQICQHHRQPRSGRVIEAAQSAAGSPTASRQARGGRGGGRGGGPGHAPAGRAGRRSRPWRTGTAPDLMPDDVNKLNQRLFTSTLKWVNRCPTILTNK
eukprot:1188235-Prorocentrum_minimum.AAC.1